MSHILSLLHCALCGVPFCKTYMLENRSKTTPNDQYGIVPSPELGPTESIDDRYHGYYDGRKVSPGMLEWLDKVVCFQQRRLENEDTAAEGTDGKSECFFSTVGCIQTTHTEKYSIDSIHVPIAKASELDAAQSGRRRSFQLYWSSPDDNIAFPFHENCATIAKFFLEHTKGCIDQFYHALKYEYFVSLGDDRAFIYFNKGYNGEGLPIDPRMTEAEKLATMNHYFDIDWSDTDYDYKGMIAYNLRDFLADRCVPWPGHWAATAFFEFLVADPLGPPAVEKTNLGQRIQETPTGDGWNDTPTRALPGQGKFEITENDSISNPPGAGISVPRCNIIPNRGVDKFWDLPVELRISIMCRLSTFGDVWTLRNASRAFGVISLDHMNSVYKAQLFGIPWLWDLDLGPSNRLALNWAAVFQDLHEVVEECDILVGVPALQNRRRIWQILEHIEYRVATSLPEKGPNPEAEMLLREFSRRMKLEQLGKRTV